MNLQKYLEHFSLKLRLWFVLNLFLWGGIEAVNFLSCPINKHQWWPDFYRISTSMLEALLVSFFLYFLVVFIPERRKKIIIKKNFSNIYNGIKKDILWQVILASINGGRKDISTDTDTFDKICTINGFREIFLKGSEGDEGFYAFRNYISDDVPEYREIILNLKILAKEIEYVLYNLSFYNSALFAFFKRLEMFLVRLEYIGPGYNEEKELSRLIWEIFGGFDEVGGFKDYDIIERMIDDI